MPAPGLLLVAAALACLVPGVVALRRSAAAPARDELPRVVRILGAVPAPGSVRGLLAGRVDAAVVVAAGLPPGVAVPALARARAGGAVLGAIMGGLMALIALPLVVMAPIGAAAGRGAGDRAVGRRARMRRAQVADALPDLLDLMVICVEAGMALDPALGLAAARLGGPLGEEVHRTLSDQSLGTPRRDAYAGLAARTGSDDVARLVASLLQAEELGTPLAVALAGQADALRAARRQRARDRAARAAPRIQLVVALVMVPGALLLILGVMVIELAAQVGVVISP